METCSLARKTRALPECPGGRILSLPRLRATRSPVARFTAVSRAPRSVRARIRPGVRSRPRSTLRRSPAARSGVPARGRGDPAGHHMRRPARQGRKPLIGDEDDDHAALAARRAKGDDVVLITPDVEDDQHVAAVHVDAADRAIRRPRTAHGARSAGPIRDGRRNSEQARP